MKKIFIALAGVFLTFHGISQDWLLTGNAGTNYSCIFKPIS